MTTASTPKTAHLTGWDRAIVIALGGAGCALSYDALQQMAIAIHVRGFLTYLFPLVIDGFIAYGVRALLVLRDAPMRARLYVWTLFGTATAASIWANALHAVRLNQNPSAAGLRLGDPVVAILSTIAPLALAGAVHLYILIARGPAKEGDRQDLGLQAGHPGHTVRPEQIAVTRTDRLGHRPPQVGQVSAGQPATAPTGRSALPPDRQTPTRQQGAQDRPAVTVAPVTDRTVTAAPVSGDPGRSEGAADLGGQSVTVAPVTDRTVTAAPVSGDPGRSDGAADLGGQPVTVPPVTDREARITGVRRPDPDTEELLDIARTAVRAEDKLTRKVVAQAIRGQKIPLSSDTLTALMVQLREQHARPVTRP